MSGVVALRDSNKTLALSGTLPEVMAQCADAHVLDKRTEKAKVLLVIGFIVAAIVAFVGLIIESWIVVVVGLVSAVALGITWAVIAPHDVEDRKLETVRTILDQLQTEIKLRRPVVAYLDFRGYDNAQAWPAWISLQVTLENGVGMKLSTSTHHKRKKRSKRKYTKIKDKIHERIDVTYTPPKGKAFDPEVQARLSATPAPPGLVLRATKVTPKAATFVFSTPVMLRLHGRGGWDDSTLTHMVDGPKAVTAVIASYRALAAARAAA